MRKMLVLAVLLSALMARADNSVLPVEVRPGVHLPVHYMRHDQGVVKGVAVLMPGGGGGLTLGALGEPENQNFLIRSRGLFFEAGYDVVSVGNPADVPTLPPRYRSSQQHVGDMETVVNFIKTRTKMPIWLIGTSRGTTSGAASAVKFGNQLLAGLVLSSSVSTGKNGGAVQGENLDEIKIPTLVVHHENDGCNTTPASGAKSIFSELKQAPIKKLMIQSGGTATGAACGPFHFHGYEGIEAQTVRAMTDWMANPSP